MHRHFFVDELFDYLGSSCYILPQDRAKWWSTNENIDKEEKFKLNKSISFNTNLC